jgi:hypothetical protein
MDTSGAPYGTYYAAVKAYSSTAESGYSNEIAIVIAPPRYPLSDEQQYVISDYGNPDYLTLFFNAAQNRREETWVYTDLEWMILFWNGEWVDAGDVAFAPAAFSKPPSLDPSLFTKDTSLRDMTSLLGNNYEEVDQSPLESILGENGSRAYHFKDKGLFTSFINDKLAVALTVDLPNLSHGSSSPGALTMEESDPIPEFLRAASVPNSAVSDSDVYFLFFLLLTITDSDDDMTPFIWADIGQSCGIAMTGHGGAGNDTCKRVVLQAIQNVSSGSSGKTPPAGVQALSQTGNALHQLAEKCPFSISPLSASFESTGGNGSIEVTGPSDCIWSAVSHTGWITVTSGGGATGKPVGSLSYIYPVDYEVAPNTTGRNRTGTITAAGQTFTVTQSASSPSCTYTVEPLSDYFDPKGGNGMIEVTTSMGCTYSAVSNAAWISITNGGSQGAAKPQPLLSTVSTVTYRVSENTTGKDRTGTITVAGQIFTVTQAAGSSCTYTIAPTSESFEAKGGSGSIEVTTTAVDCAYTAVSHANWITVSSTGSRQATKPQPLLSFVSIVTYSVVANTTLSSRTGTMTVAGQTFTVTQAGAQPACTYTYSSCTGPCQADGKCPVNMTGYSPADCTGTPETTQPCPACTGHTFTDSECRQNEWWMGIQGLGTITRTFTGVPQYCSGGVAIPTPTQMCCDGFNPC